MEDDDGGWDGPNIRPPQASGGDRIRQRSRSRIGRSSRHRDGDRSKKHRRGDIVRPRQQRGDDLRNRLNRGDILTFRDRRSGGSRNRDDKRRKPLAGNRDDRRRLQARQSSDPRAKDRLNRLMVANASKAESRRDVEVRRQRREMEKQAQEAEKLVHRKRDRSRDRREVTDKKAKKEGNAKAAKSNVEEGEEEEEEVGEGNSDENSEDDDEEDDDSDEEDSDSDDDTASEQSEATPVHEDDDEEEEGEEEEEEEVEEVEDGEETGEDGEGSSGEEVDDKKKNPLTKSPPKSDDESGSDDEDEADEEEAPVKAGEVKQAESPRIEPEHDERDDLPVYLPSIYGCRSVEEFHCLNRIEEGTYGVVYRARDKKTSEIVALKRLKMEREKEGFPITSLREINTLLISQHKNVVHVREIVVGSNMDKIFIVMDFVQHDMKSLMETMREKNHVFLPSEVKCLMVQLLRAIAHLHDNWILHRDLKTSNLLLSHKGILKVGDFGLAREYGSPLKPYTGIVVTLWYRAPELLLGIKEYSTFIDVWSIGCIFAEFLLMEPLFPGKSDIDQLNRIFKLFGTPSEKIWPGYNKLPAVQKMKFVEFPVSQMRSKFPQEMLSAKGLNLLKSLLTYDPHRRTNCENALQDPYFDEAPLPIDPSMFPSWPAKSELSSSSHKKAASPKPPSGGGAFKKINDDDDEAKLSTGFSFDLRNNPPVAAGWNLKF